MKKALALLLSFLMLLTAIPMSVFAYENVTNMEYVTGAANAGRFESLGMGFNALSDTEIKDTTIKHNAVIDYDALRATVLSTSDTQSFATYKHSIEDLMLAFGIDYNMDGNGSLPLNAAKVGFTRKFGIKANLTGKQIKESLYYYFRQETVTGRMSLYLPESVMDNVETALSSDFLYAVERLDQNLTRENVAAFYENWGTHILVSYNKGAALEYVATAHSTKDEFSGDATLNSNIGATLGIDKVSVGSAQNISATLNAHYNTSDYNLNHNWYAYGGVSNLVDGKDASAEQIGLDISAWQESISQSSAALIPQSSQWKAIWEFVPAEYEDLRDILQAYYQSMAIGVNAKFFEQFTNYTVSASNFYYMSVAKDANGNHLIYNVSPVSEMPVAPGSKTNLVDLGTDLSKGQVVVNPAGYATVDANGIVTFAAEAQPGTVVTVTINEKKADGELGEVLASQKYTIVNEGADGQFAGGYGTAERPYLISTSTQFGNLRNFTDENLQYCLTNDIDLGNIAPIPNFNATLDGKGYTVSGWQYDITAAGNFGLFCNNFGTIKNLNITNFSLLTKGNPKGSLTVGTLCGTNKGTIENVHVTKSKVYGDMGDMGSSAEEWGSQMVRAGGLCGLNRKIIRKSGVSYCNGDYYLDARTFTYSANASATTMLGGVVGQAAGPDIVMEDLYSHDNTLVGHTETSDPWWFEHVNGFHHLGGIIGSINQDVTPNAKITRVIAYDIKFSSTAIDVNENCVGSISGFARKADLVDCYGKYGENHFGRNETGDKTGAITDLTAAGAINNMTGFATHGWYQDENGGHPRIAQDNRLYLNDYDLDKEYFVGEALNYNGLIIKPVKEGSTVPGEAITGGYTISGYNPDEVGTQTITVSYGALAEGTYTVTVKEPSISELVIASLPEKTSYFKNETTDLTGLTVYAKYDDGTVELVDPSRLVCTETSFTETENRVTVSYADCTTSFIVHKYPVVLTGIAILSMPEQTEFKYRETFNYTGLAVELHYNNGTTVPADTAELTISQPDMYTYGTQTVTISYQDKSCTYSIVIDGCIHADTVREEGQQPTCEQEGQSAYTYCVDCHEIVEGVDQVLPATGHDWQAASCTEPKICKTCGVTEGGLEEHSYKTVITQQPACTTAGVKTHTCLVCGHSYTESIPATGHDWQAATCIEPKSCAVCGITIGESLGHSYHAAITQQPTCTISGVMTYTCLVCGHSYTESIPATGHDWQAATCTELKTCQVCGLAEGQMLDHVYDNACDNACNNCGITREVAAHVWEEGACSVCGVASPTKVKVTTAPKTTYGKEGAAVKVTVKATGEGLKYAWYLKSATGTKYSKSSVTSSTYSVKISDASHGRRIYCIITDQYGNKVQTATVLVRRQATITKEPATVVYAKKDAKASVKITAKGDGLKYAWYIKNDGASKYSKSSVTSSTYSATMGSKVKGRRVYCVVTDKYGKKVQSKTFLLRESVSITTQPKTVTVAKNKTAKITVKASGDGLKYTWYVKDAGKTKYSKSSITKSTYSVKMTSKVKNRLVYCVVTDKYGNTVKTVTVKLKMK